jgi:hypothetical protein
MKSHTRKELHAFLREPKNQEHAVKLTLIGIFISIFTAFVSRKPKKGQERTAFELKPFDLALLGLATFRLGRMVAYDRIAEPLREPFTQTVPDPTGAGETVEPRGEGVRLALGQAISCPICSGTWIAAALVYGLHSLPNPTRLFLAMISSTGIAELLNALTEALSWTAQAARKKAGKPKPRMRAQAKKMHKSYIYSEEESNHGRNYSQYHRESRRGNGF